MRTGYLEPLTLATGGGLLIALSLQSQHVSVLTAILPTDLWASRSMVLHDLFTGYGAALLIAAGVSCYAVRQRETTLVWTTGRLLLRAGREVVALRGWIWRAAECGTALPWLAALTLIGAAVRFSLAQQPMRYDESYTFLNFVNRSYFELFYYPIPNNHVLHTLLARCSSTIFGGDPVFIRLPAMIAGVAVIPVSYCVAKLLSGRSSGIFTAALAAVYPYLILYDTMARGYSLSVLLTLLLVLLGLRLIDRFELSTCLLLSVGIALGLLNMPSFLFPAAGVFSWIALLLLLRGHRPAEVVHRFVFPTVLTAGIFTALFYTPTIVVSDGVESLVANRFVVGLPWGQFSEQLPQHLTSVASDFMRGVPWWAAAAALLLSSAGIACYVRERQWAAAVLLPALIVAAGLLLVAKHAIPFARTWIYFLPLVFALMDSGFSLLLLRGLSGSDSRYQRSLRWSRYSMLAGAAAVAVAIVNTRTIQSYADTGAFPEAAAVVEALAGQMTTEDEIAALIPADAPTIYYMWLHNVPRPASDRRPARRFFVVKPSHYALRDLTEDPVRHLAKFGDAELYVSQ